MNDQARTTGEAYDAEAEAAGWLGPEVAFGLAFRYIRPGESILDLGVGTGLASELFRKAGLKPCGVDLDSQMLDVCRAKGLTDVVLHDLTRRPYPFASESFDHAVCVGVLNFLADPSAVVTEAARIIRREGLFVFAAGDRAEGEEPEYVLGPEDTGEEAPVTMYRHDRARVMGWLDAAGLVLLRDLPFDAFMDHERLRRLPVHAYLAKKG